VLWHFVDGTAFRGRRRTDLRNRLRHKPHGPGLPMNTAAAQESQRRPFLLLTVIIFSAAAISHPSLSHHTGPRPAGTKPSIPTPAQRFSDADLARRTIERRAVEAVIWGMPVVNFDLMYQAMVLETKGTFNQIVYWSRLPDWKNQTLTPNPDSIYFMPFFNTKEVGPV